MEELKTLYHALALPDPEADNHRQDIVFDAIITYMFDLDPNPDAIRGDHVPAAHEFLKCE
jgi:hypothetical protein